MSAPAPQRERTWSVSAAYQYGLCQLAFAARRQILSSEGTKAGLPIATAAWWVAVVGGLGYLAGLSGFQRRILDHAASPKRLLPATAYGGADLWLGRDDRPVGLFGSDWQGRSRVDPGSEALRRAP